MSEQTTSKDTANVISSPGSADGPWLFDMQDGPTTDQCGPEAAPASPSRRQGKARGQRTSGTCGRSSPASSASVALQASMENRLRQLLDTAGSMEYSQTWRQKVTPAGRLYLAHTASARRTSGSGSTVTAGYPSPVAQMANGEPEDFLRRKMESVARGNSMGICLSDLNMVAKLAGYPTPNVNERGLESRESKDTRNSGGIDLQSVATLAGWSSSSRDWKDTPGMATEGVNPDGSLRKRDDMLPRQAAMVLSGHVSPTAKDGTRGSLPPRSSDTGIPLDQMSAMVSGPATPSCPTGTANRGALNPNLSAWLMGMPWKLRLCGLLAFLKRRQRKSSRRSRSPETSPAGGCS